MAGFDIAAFKNVVQSGSQIIVDSQSQIRELSTGERLGRFLVKCLLNIPWLKDTLAVKKWAAEIGATNTHTFCIFLNALARLCGSASAVAAGEKVTQGRMNIQLSKRKISQMISVAESFRGLGDARPMARKACLYVWEFKDLQRTGHAAIQIKNDISPKSRDHVSEYVSWWPSSREDINVQSNSAMEALPVIGRHFESRPAMMAENYESDMEDEISERTNDRLQEAEKARRILRNLENKSLNNSIDISQSDDFVDLQGEYERIQNEHRLRKAATYFPRGAQEKLSNNKWGMAAEKVFFPLMGRNQARDGETLADVNAQPLTLFGLSEAGMLADAQKLREDAAEGRIGYSMISTTENCAAIAARSLRAGLSEIYVPFSGAWISEDPNKIHLYGKQVQDKVDELNGKAEGLKRTCAALWAEASPNDYLELKAIHADIVHSAALLKDCTDELINAHEQDVNTQKTDMEAELRSIKAFIPKKHKALETHEKAIENNKKLIRSLKSTPFDLSVLIDNQGQALRREAAGIRQAERDLIKLEKRSVQLGDSLQFIEKLEARQREDSLGDTLTEFYSRRVDHLADCVKKLSVSCGAYMRKLDKAERTNFSGFSAALKQLADSDFRDMKTCISSFKTLVEEGDKMSACENAATRDSMVLFSGIAVDIFEGYIGVFQEQKLI